jgi:hypothetical protein
MVMVMGNEVNRSKNEEGFDLFLVEIVCEMWRFLDVTDVPVTIDSPPDDAAELDGLAAPLGLERIHSSAPHAAQSGLGR